MSRRQRPLNLCKYSGAGNDFLILDAAAEDNSGEAGALAKALCRRGVSVGADGLVVISYDDLEPDSGAVARMRLWNADGSSAEFSGNAARCAIRYLSDEGRASEGSVRLQTDIGIVAGHVEADVVRVEVPGIARVWPQRRLRVEGKDLVGTYVVVGVPFFVLLHDNPDELPVRYLGRAIRTHPDLQPAGANVDFVRIDSEQGLYFRVYERGVENETLSSGTGSISAALAAAAAGRVASPVACETRGGILTVRFQTARPSPPPPPDRGDDSPPEGGTEAAPPIEGTATGEPGAEEGIVSTDGPPKLPRVATGEPMEFEGIELEGDTRQVMKATAFADALRLR